MSHIPRAVCVGCGREMVTKKAGLTAQALATFGPYYKVHADKVQCELCEVEVLVGFALSPIVEHYEPGFAAVPATVDFVFSGERYPTDKADEVRKGIAVIERRLEVLRRKLDFARASLEWLERDKIVTEIPGGNPFNAAGLPGPWTHRTTDTPSS